MKRLFFFVIAIIAMATQVMAQVQAPKDGNVYHGYQVQEMARAYWGGGFSNIDNNGFYVYDGGANVFKKHCCPPGETKTETVTKIEYRDREIIKEVPVYVNDGNKNQTADINALIAFMMQQQKTQQDEFLMEQLRIQKRQGRARIAFGTIIGMAQGTGSILSGVGNYRYGTAAMNGLLQNFFTNVTTVNNGGGTTYVPTDGLQVNPGGGNNNGGGTYVPTDGQFVDSWVTGSSGSSGSTGYGFYGNSNSGGGSYSNFSPGDGRNTSYGFYGQ